MRKVVVFTHLTLDGVMQAPGRPDEDRRGGFKHAGWETPYADAVMGEPAAKRMASGGAMLFGCRTYQDFADVWPMVDTKTTKTGVVIATYRPAAAVKASKV